MILMKKINDIKAVLKDALQHFGIHYEEITAKSTDDGKTIVLAKKNSPVMFENFTQFIKAQGFNYQSYFCPTRHRIKIDVSF